jgi:hypothetical protein
MTTAALAPDPTPDPTPPPVRDRGLRRELLVALAVAVALAAIGLPLGLLWRAVTPRVEFVMTDFGATTVESEPEGFAAADGWYVLITFAVGVLAAIAVWALIRRRGPLALLGLVVGSVAGGVLTAWLGQKIGYAHYRSLLTHAQVGTHFFRPPSVRSGRVGLWFGFLPRVQGAFLVQAVAAATTYVVLAAFHTEPDLRRSGMSPHGLPAASGPAPGDESPVGPADGISWARSEWTAPPGSPAPPGSGQAEQPRD